MHGLGNDFVIIDDQRGELRLDSAAAAAIADRRTGIGCDQLILLQPSRSADRKMRIFNADGGEVDACGNASRCVVALLGGELSIETAGGIVKGSRLAEGASVTMGPPLFGWDEIPLAYAMDTETMPIGWENLDQPAAVKVGNPHIIFFVEDPGAVPLERLGPLIETDPLFPNRINVNVAAFSNGALSLRTWERGAGLTRACGTGACASAVAAIRRGLVETPVEVHMPGGMLVVDWRGAEEIIMTGPASHVFEGRADWSRFR